MWCSLRFCDTSNFPSSLAKNKRTNNYNITIVHLLNLTSQERQRSDKLYLASATQNYCRHSIYVVFQVKEKKVLQQFYKIQNNQMEQFSKRQSPATCSMPHVLVSDSILCEWLTVFPF